MKRYTIYASDIGGPEAFNMVFTLFDDFIVSRGYGLTAGGGNEVQKFVIITIFADASEQSKVTDLRDKFATRSGKPARATNQDITILP